MTITTSPLGHQEIIMVVFEIEDGDPITAKAIKCVKHIKFCTGCEMTH